MDDDSKELYTLEQLIAKLERLRDGEIEPINFAKAIYTLANEIKFLRSRRLRKEDLD